MCIRDRLRTKMLLLYRGIHTLTGPRPPPPHPVGDGSNYKVTISSCRGSRVQLERHYHIIPRGGNHPFLKPLSFHPVGTVPRPKQSLLIPVADSWFSSTVIPHTSSSPPHSVAVFSCMTLAKSDVFSQIRNDPKEEQGHTPSKECCLYAAIFQCA